MDGTTWIASGLYQGGSFQHAYELPADVNVVVNLTEDPDPELPPGRLKAHLWCPLRDSIPSVTWLMAMTGFIATCQVQGWNVLVHCEYGVNRSTFLTTACLMRANHWSRDIALTFVRCRVPGAQPHLGFMSALGDWERYLAAGRAA